MSLSTQLRDASILKLAETRRARELHFFKPFVAGLQLLFIFLF
ncbi:hypothetical protein Hanom_Chr12g01072421 [Helianthus anomalus]